jgi:hypothetical protein
VSEKSYRRPQSLCPWPDLGAWNKLFDTRPGRWIGSFGSKSPQTINGVPVKLRNALVLTAVALIGLLVPLAANADDTSDAKLFVGKWKGQRAGDVWVFNENGTFVSNPDTIAPNRGKWHIKGGKMHMEFEPLKNKITWDAYTIDKDQYTRTYTFSKTVDTYKRIK